MPPGRLPGMRFSIRRTKVQLALPVFIIATVLSLVACGESAGTGEGSGTSSKGESEEVKALREASRKQAEEAADPSIAARRRAETEAANPANSAECKRQRNAFNNREIEQSQMTAECRKAFGMSVGAPGGS